jgi:hypothetical protein
MKLSGINTLPLHDATLESIELVWKEAQCRVVVTLESGTHLLTFGGVTKVSIPRDEPWGSSISVNEASFERGVATIEMQSGDTIEITAQEVEFSTL